MPGSKPGERRGGRQKGSLNKATIERDQKLAEARDRVLASLTPEMIAAMSPLDVMLQAMYLEAQTGEWRTAAALAEKAAPYLHSKKIAASEGADDDKTVTITGGLPPDANR